MNDQIIGVREWCDGSIRDVYADRDGQYIRSGTGGKVYGSWIEAERARPELSDSATATLVGRVDSTVLLQALSQVRARR
jgi:hypothetical protein